MDDLFDAKNIAPMLIAENSAIFTDHNFLYEMKWDGERCIAFLDPTAGTDLRNNRNVRMLPKVPELSELHQQASGRCILDGELLCVINGKPSFEAIQRRSLMSNRYKIELESKLRPAAFIAFDCLYYEGHELATLPLTERKEYLRKAITVESERLAISRGYDAEQAADLFRLTREQGLEGIVAKRKSSLYFFGKRTKNWLKIKNLMDDDFVICGYIRKESNMTSIVLGQYSDHKLLYQGHVTLGVGSAAFGKIKAQPRIPWPPFTESVPSGQGNGNAVWLEPRLVCTVEFMHRTKCGGMRQPVFKGLRQDKTPESCVKQPW